MICPLLVIGYTAINDRLLKAEDKKTHKYHVHEMAQCSHLCAWYDKAKEQCCIKTLSQLKIGVVSTHPA